MTDAKNKSLMRSLGEFVGHIVKGVKTDPDKTTLKKEIRREVEEEDRGDMILRRTTIEEVEFKSKENDSSDTDAGPTETDC